jgi:hypothetical protein
MTHVVDLDLPDLRKGCRYRLREYTLDEADEIFRAVCTAWGRPIADLLTQALGAFFVASEEALEAEGAGADPESARQAAIGAALARVGDSFQVGVVVQAVGLSGIAAMFRLVARGHLVRVEQEDGQEPREVEVLPAAKAAADKHAATAGGVAKFYAGGDGMADAALLTFACLKEALGPLGQALAGAARGLLPGRGSSPTRTAPAT